MQNSSKCDEVFDRLLEGSKLLSVKKNVCVQECWENGRSGRNNFGGNDAAKE